MSPPTDLRPIRRRPETMTSADTAERIAEAAICVIATHGLARLTHRAVAAEAGVALSATTRHFETKAEIIAVASDRLLKGYLAAFDRAADRQRDGRGLAPDLPALVRLLSVNAAGHRRRDSLAWCEIMLNAGRTAQGQALARHWFDELNGTWAKLVAAMGVAAGPAQIEAAMDIVIGLLFVILPLDLNPEQTDRALERGIDPGMLPPPFAETAPEPRERATAKARETKERIMKAAIAIMIDRGPEELAYRAISEQAGLSLAAPAYHFGSIDRLIAHAQDRMFAIAQDRYREMLGTLPASPRDIEELVDFTAAIFAREATEFVAINRATYTIWLEATRTPALRGSVGRSVSALQAAWRSRLERIDARSAGIDGLGALALYIGKFIRISACGSRTGDLARMRAGFHIGLGGMAQHEAAGTFF